MNFVLYIYILAFICGMITGIIGFRLIQLHSEEKEFDIYNKSGKMVIICKKQLNKLGAKA